MPHVKLAERNAPINPCDATISFHRYVRINQELLEGPVACRLLTQYRLALSQNLASLSAGGTLYLRSIDWSQKKHSRLDQQSQRHP